MNSLEEDGRVMIDWVDWILKISDCRHPGHIYPAYSYFNGQRGGEEGCVCDGACVLCGVYVCYCYQCVPA